MVIDLQPEPTHHDALILTKGDVIDNWTILREVPVERGRCRRWLARNGACGHEMELRADLIRMGMTGHCTVCLGDHTLAG